MKLNNIHFRNYKCYPDTSFEFSDGLNVLVGGSDSGKSAMVIGAHMLVTGKTKSRNYIHRGGEQCQITVSDYKDSVTLIKGKPNQYIINKDGKEDILTKIDSSSIQKAQETLNLSVANIQTQREHFFLLDKSAGERARVMNDIAGLSNIDSSIKDIKSTITAQTKELKKVQADLEKDTSFLVDTLWAEDAIIQYDKIQSNKKKVRALKDKFVALNRLVEQRCEIERRLNDGIPQGSEEATEFILNAISEYNNIVNQRDELSRLFQQHIDITHKLIDSVPTGMIDATQSILDKLDDLKEYRSQAETLQNLIIHRKSITDKLKECIPVLDLDNKFYELEVANNSIKKAEKVLTEYSSYGKTKETLLDKINTTNREVMYLQKELDAIGVCPTCGQELT